MGIRDPVFHLDDSARPHRGKKIEKWNEDNQIKKVEWPGNSPDLNPIENLWALLKQKLQNLDCSTKVKLIENILHVWNHEIGKNIIENLVESMPRRLQSVIENKGYSSKY